MPSSQDWKKDGSKTSTSRPFPINLGDGTKNYNVKTEANIDQKNVKASKITLQDEVKQGNTTITRPLASSTDGGKTWILEKDSEGKSILDSTQIAALYPGNKLYTAARNAAQIDARSNGAEDKQVNQLTNGNASTDPTSGTDPQTVPLSDEARDELNSGSRENTRTSYESTVYPENLKSDFQDCIKFSIVNYQPPGLSGFEESAAGSRYIGVENGIPKFPGGKNRKEILATITLPIPGGIQDSNSVNWSRGEINPIEEAVANIAITALGGGDVGAATNTQLEGAVSAKDEVRQSIIKWAAQTAVGANNIMQRQFGTIINPNVELLFNSPELRTFSFSFKLSPRSSSEAQKVKTIIRNFKQAMSVKRSSSSFLLQTPHTFAISYIFKNKAHPYLNRFKECALISCNVNYTPEGNFMAFDDSQHPSMVSYQLDLTFQELEPLYDDEYGINDYDNIGF